MTQKDAEKIIGVEVAVEARPRGYFRASCVDCFGVTLMETARNVSQALALLVRSNYASSRKFVLERDKYRCVNCGAFGAMQCDHVRARSHGRDDRPENLFALCDGCHGIRHRNSKTFYGVS